MKVKRNIVGTAIFLALLGTTISVTAWIIDRINRPKSKHEEKLENADLVRYYLVDEEQGPTFELRKDDRVLKFITHAELDGYEPSRRILYGFHVHIKDPSGDTLWDTEIYTRTRQSKDGERDGDYERENTFGVTRGTEYGDDRLLEIRLPDGLPNNALLTLRLLGATNRACPVQRALLRVYRKVPRSAVSQQLRLLSLSLGGKRKLAKRVGIPWDLLPTEQQRSMLAYRWDRMAALGEAGSDFKTRLVLYSGFRTTPERDDEKRGTHVYDLHNAAINVLSPEPFELTLLAMPYTEGSTPRCAPPGADRWARARPFNGQGKTEPVAAANLSVDIISDDGVPSHSFVVTPDKEGFKQNVLLPAGLHSLHIKSDSSEGVVFCLTADKQEHVQFGSVDPIPLGDPSQPLGEQLVVDVRRLPAYLSGGRADETPIDTYIDGPPGIESRTFLLEVRVLMDAARWTDELPVLTYRFLDERGDEVAAGSTHLPPVFAPFEKVRLPTPAALTGPDDSCGPQRAKASALQPVSEPLRMPVIAPPSARILQVETDKASVIRVLSHIDDTSRYEAPYRDYMPELMIWRYGPRERRRWFPTRPENRDELAKTGRIARIRTQVRLEPRVETQDTKDQRVAVLLEPERPPERQLILESVAAERVADVVKRWSSGGLYTALQDKTRIYVPASVNKRPKLRYFIKDQDTQLLGMRVDIKVDGEVVHTRRLVTPRGIWSLPYLPKQDVARARGHEVECAPSEQQDMAGASRDELARRLTCYIDLPPVQQAKADIVRARTVYPMDHRPLRLVVKKEPGRDLVVNAVVYDKRVRERAGRWIHASVDGGNPKRMVGSLVSGISKADRWWPLPSARVMSAPMFVDLANRTPGLPRTVALRLGDDLRPGRHIVVFEAPALSGWVRFFTYDLDPSESESAWQWQFESPDRPRGDDE